MVRPRLVEEGKPIGYSKNNGATQDGGELADLEMDLDEHHNHNHHHHHHPHRHEQQTQAWPTTLPLQQYPQLPVDPSSHSSSSLLRALGDSGRTGPVSRRHVTRVVIGGGGDAYDDGVDSEGHVHAQQEESSSSSLSAAMMQHDHDALEMEHHNHPLNHNSDETTSSSMWRSTLVQSGQPLSFAAQPQYPPLQEQQHEHHPLHPQQQQQQLPTHGSYYQRHQLPHPEPTNVSFEPSSTSPSFSAPSTLSQPSYNHPVVAHATHLEIGAHPDHDHPRQVERMTGVEDHSVQPPLIVLDGANVAYAYAHASSSLSSSASSSSSTVSTTFANSKPIPDIRGIRVATDYFRSAGLRVLVVVPQSWLRVNTSSSTNHKNKILLDEDGTLLRLQQDGHIVAAPARSDDDAFCLTICQRENARVIKNYHERNQQQRGPAYCLSNDLFRDAQARDSTGRLQSWLEHGVEINHTLYHHAHAGSGTLSTSETLSETGPGRISFAFCDMGTMNDHGDREMDIVPNPRHPLVQWIEQHHLQKSHH